MTDIPELTPEQLFRAIPARTRKRILLGQIESGDEIVALGRFVGLTQARFGIGSRADELLRVQRSRY